MTNDIISTSRELWHCLQRDAGLDVSWNDAIATYDTAFETELRDSLFGGAVGDFGTLLESNVISVERLLTSFFRALAPFARIVSEILEMFELAAATSSDRNIRIAIDVTPHDETLNFDINAFREIVGRIYPIFSMVSARKWTYDNARSLDDIILESGIIPDFYEPYIDKPKLESVDIQEWLDAMTARTDFPKLPPVAPTGIPEFDNLVSDLWADFNNFQCAARERFGTYDRILTTPREGPDFRGWEWKLLRAAHDLWPFRIVQLLALLGEALRRDPGNPMAAQCVMRLVSKVAMFSTPAKSREIQIEALQNIFRLPVWQRRHELYAVWVASLITRRLRPFGVEFHCEGGVLSFPFKTTHLASIGDTSKWRPELWSELRVPAVEPTGKRLESVQPDYRIRFPASVHSENLTAADDIMVIECKQYKRSSARPFAEAPTDYAKAATAAHILLFNFGPVSPRTRTRVASEIVRRYHPIGEVYPGGKGLAEAKRALSSLATAVFGHQIAPHWMMDSIEIELRWEGHGVDLDLHVTTPEAACGYDSPDGLPDVTFDRDELGDGSGHHVEKLRLSPTGSCRYDIVVRLHSGAHDFRKLGAEVAISWNETRGRNVKIVSLYSAGTRDWHVATLLEGHSRPIEVNRPAQGFVSGRGWRPPL